MENVPQVDIQAILRKGSAFKLIMDLVEHIVSLAKKSQKHHILSFKRKANRLPDVLAKKAHRCSSTRKIL